MNEQTQQFSPPIKIVRASNRCKFLVGLLGSAAILAVGSPGLWQLAQNMQVASNVKNYPYNFGDDLVGESYSPDLNFMAMVKVGEEDNQDAKLHIWDYQQQRMTTLPTGPDGGDPAWSSDNRYLLSQMWYTAFSEIHWSPDGFQIALNLKDDADTFVILSSVQLQPLFTFTGPVHATHFVWSPDGKNRAFLIDESQNSSWGIQIWDLQACKMKAEITLQGQENAFLSRFAWSPDGAHIAALTHGQLHIINVGDPLTSYALDEPNKYGQLAWSPDGKHLAVAVREPGDFSAGSTFGVWDIVERKQVHVFHRGLNADVPDALAWSKDGKFIRMIADVYEQENWIWQ